MGSKVHRTDEIQGDIIHEYDGIEEADNRLPNWWLATFYITIVFSVGYWFYYHVYESGRGPMEAYAFAREEEREDAASEITVAMLEELAEDPSALAEGKAAYMTNCVACHDEQGQGKIGPNLTDEYWIHGGSATDIYRMVAEGNVVKGMPGWRQVLGAQKTKEVTAYVISLRGSNVSGKAPEGERWSAEQDEADTEGADQDSADNEAQEHGDESDPDAAEPSLEQDDTETAEPDTTDRPEAAPQGN